MEIWIYIIAAIIILILFFANKSKSEEIQRLNSLREEDKNRYSNEIKVLTEQVATRNIEVENEKNKTSRLTSSLRVEIANLKNEYHNKIDALKQKYYMLMRAYMLARKKGEIDVIHEIEESIKEDYEALGSTHTIVAQYVASAMADFYTVRIKDTEKHLKWMGQVSRSDKIAEVRKAAELVIQRAKLTQYSFELALVKLLQEHPELDISKVDAICGITVSESEQYCVNTNEEISKYKQKIYDLERECASLRNRIEEIETFQDKRWPLLRESIEAYQKEFESNLTAIPYMSRIIADVMTLDLDRLAWSLSWGQNKDRNKKVASLMLLKKEKSEEIERIKSAEYQLAYLLELYPNLQDVIDAEFKELDISYKDITEMDPVHRYIDTIEWDELSESERNQLALDRYVESRQKSKWQIGRDYELYCGYCYEKQGYHVDYYGSLHGLEDLGRDLIVTFMDDIRIVQCKYWSQSKQIHENHIMQLYGSVIEYNLENKTNAMGILITNTTLSDKAKEFAKILGISYKENYKIDVFPRIKCNIGVEGKIYHLPFDQQYDTTIIEDRGEFMALTVKEAEDAGFRRAYRWHGNE